MVTEKQCKGPCGRTLSVDEFHWKSKRKGTRQPKCKACMSEYGKTHYSTNSDKYKERANSRLQLLRSTNRENVKAYLASHPCSKCGESNPKVLTMNVTSIEINNMASEAFLQKLLGSTVLCHNCKVSQD